MATTRLALTIAGGVSLGAFEAGVVDELTHTLDALTRLGRGPFEIDVITGGSAGSLTGLLAARGIVSDYAGRRRDLFKGWVELIGVGALVEGPAPANAVFETSAIDRIAERLLRDGGGAASPAAFSPRGRGLSLRFSMSNMNGVDYLIRYLLGTEGGSAAFPSTFFSDMGSFEVDASTPMARWREAAECAKASGNFPLAFPPRAVARRGSDYPGSALEGDPAYDAWRPLMVDGGLFNNEPLREAFQVANENDETARADDQRVFLLIDPFVNASRARRELDASMTVGAYAGRLLAMLRGEASAKDFLRSQRRNNELAWRDAMLEVLAAIPMATDPASLRDVGAMAQRAAEGILAVKRELNPGRYEGVSAAELVERNWGRLPRRPFSDNAAGDPRRGLLMTLAFVLNNAAGLQHKTHADVHLIGADATRDLAGDPGEGFGGFFIQDWRHHDYIVGRRRARQSLSRILGFEPGAVGPEVWPGGVPVDYAVPPAWGEFPGMTMQDVREREPELYETVRNTIADRIADVVVETFGVSSTLVGCFRRRIRGAVDSLLLRGGLVP